MILLKVPMNWWSYDSRMDHNSYAHNMPSRRKSLCPMRNGSGGYYFFADHVWHLIEPTSGVFVLAPAHYGEILVYTPHLQFEDDADAILFRLTHM